MKICILGCGPAGLLSAWACTQYGATVTIISRKTKSQIPGAVFLHEPIAGLTAPEADGEVNFVKHGTRAGYAKKVYGRFDADCSWDLFPQGKRPAWSMFALYDYLWQLYEPVIVDQMINQRGLSRIMRKGQFDLVISTIPVPFICHRDEHNFESQGIFILDQAVESAENTIVYNGSMADQWYRSSRLFGNGSTESTSEFSDQFVYDLGANMTTGYKPIQTDCNCFPQVARIGRFGMWRKGILVHHAYQQTVQLLEAL